MTNVYTTSERLAEMRGSTIGPERPVPWYQAAQRCDLEAEPTLFTTLLQASVLDLNRLFCFFASFEPDAALDNLQTRLDTGHITAHVMTSSRFWLALASQNEANCEGRGSNVLSHRELFTPTEGSKEALQQPKTPIDTNALERFGHREMAFGRKGFSAALQPLEEEEERGGRNINPAN